MKIYIAGYFNTRARLRPIRDKINKMGHEVTSTWLSERGDSNQDKNVLPEYERYKRYANRDLDEIAHSTLLIVDTFDITERGGREVEYGFALAHTLEGTTAQTQEVWVVGPIRNVFHQIAHAKFASWEEALECLKTIPTQKI